MRGRAAAAGLLALVLAAGCSNPLRARYEYEEQLYLSVDGSATVVIDASIPALVALRNLPLNTSSRVGVDRDHIRELFASAGCVDVRVGQPWVRSGRRFIQVTVAAEHVADLESCEPLAWSTYGFERDESGIHFEQTLGPPVGGDPGPVTWDGTELVAFKLHAPGRIHFHNVRRLRDGAAGTAARGNILTWEQRLADRRAGQPVRMEVRMGGESILFRTLWLFGLAFAAAVTAILTTVWIAIRRARRAHD